MMILNMAVYEGLRTKVIVYRPEGKEGSVTKIFWGKLSQEEKQMQRPCIYGIL